MKPRGTILMAMSGGVDSSLAASILLRDGWQVHGAVLDLAGKPGETGTCASGETVIAATAAADHLGITLHRIEATDLFKNQIIKSAWETYAAGLTPNPCIWCNNRLKFGLLLQEAEKLGADYVASGHYARILPGPRLLRGRDPGKDQSYFLARVKREKLSRILLPMGDFTKQTTRKMAAELGLPAARKKDSQDACLPPVDSSFAEALRQRLDEQDLPGNFVDPNGKVLGQHFGLHRYTIGQRRGLGIALGKPAFVSALRPAQGEVVLTTREADLMATTLTASDMRWITTDQPVAPFHAIVQLRSRPSSDLALVTPLPDQRTQITFTQPQRAITPGQAAVIYNDDEVLGTGWIDRPGEPQ